MPGMLVTICFLAGKCCVAMWCCVLQEAAAAVTAAEENAAQEEADRQQRIKDSFAAQMPDEISQKVQAALQKEMVSLHRHGNACACCSLIV